MKDAATLMRAVASAQKYDNISKKACLDDFKVMLRGRADVVVFVREYLPS